MMKRFFDPIRILIALLLLAIPGFAGEENAQTRELPPLTSSGVEKMFYANMDRIKIPGLEQKAEFRDVLAWMSKWDRKQNDRGGSINRGIELGPNWNGKKKIWLSQKEYTYRTMLDETCAQADLYWWVEDDPWIGVIIGSQSVYLEHQKNLAEKRLRKMKAAGER